MKFIYNIIFFFLLTNSVVALEPNRFYLVGNIGMLKTQDLQIQTSNSTNSTSTKTINSGKNKFHPIGFIGLGYSLLPSFRSEVLISCYNNNINNVIMNNSSFKNSTYSISLNGYYDLLSHYLFKRVIPNINLGIGLYKNNAKLFVNGNKVDKNSEQQLFFTGGTGVNVAINERVNFGLSFRMTTKNSFLLKYKKDGSNTFITPKIKK